MVEFQTMEARDAHDLARSADIDSVAAGFPLSLIEPFAEAQDPAPLAPGQISWGINAIGADSTPFTGKGIKVAVLDTGIDRNHVAFQGVELTEVDYTGEGNGDNNGHGTHCAGTIFGRDVNGSRIGVARGITQAFIGKVIGKNTTATTAILLRAIREAAEQGCQVISMSLGFDFPGATVRLQRLGLEEPLAFAIALSDYRANVRLFDKLGEMMQAESEQNRREVMLFAASGNGSKRQMDPNYEMPAAPPSEASGFTSVGALEQRPDGKFAVANFSNAGCALCAPGKAIISARANTPDGLLALSGTSMATPHAAGIAALHLEKDKNAAPAGGFLRFKLGVLERILGSASLDPLIKGTTRNQVGLGMIRAPQA